MELLHVNFEAVSEQDIEETIGYHLGNGTADPGDLIPSDMRTWPRQIRLKYKTIKYL